MYPDQVRGWGGTFVVAPDASTAVIARIFGGGNNGSRLSSGKVPVRPDNFLFLVGGCHGTGKSSLVQLLHQRQRIDTVLRETTREKREGGDDPLDVHVSPEEFESRKEAGKYVFDYVVDHIPDPKGNPSQYGFSVSTIERLFSNDVILTASNAANVKKVVASFRDRGVHVIPLLITPNKSGELEPRLRQRRTTSEDLERRLETLSEQYIAHLALARVDPRIYSHVIVNSNPSKYQKAWEQNRGRWDPAFRLGNSDKERRLKRGVFTKIDIAYARLAQIISFYRGFKGRLPDYEQATVLQAYVDFFSRALFGVPFDDALSELKNQKVLPFNIQLATEPGIARYLSERYWIKENSPIPRRKGVTFYLNRCPDTKEDERDLDSYIRATLGGLPLGYFVIDQKTEHRVFSLTDRKYDPNVFTRIELAYYPKSSLELIKK